MYYWIYCGRPRFQLPLGIISIIFSGEKEHEAIRRMQTQSFFLVLLSVIIPLVLVFETIFVGNTTELFYEIIKQQGLIRLFLAKVTVMLYWKYCLSAQQFINLKTRTAEFVAFNNVLRLTDKLQPIFETFFGSQC